MQGHTMDILGDIRRADWQTYEVGIPSDILKSERTYFRTYQWTYECNFQVAFWKVFSVGFLGWWGKVCPIVCAGRVRVAVSGGIRE